MAEIAAVQRDQLRAVKHNLPFSNLAILLIREKVSPEVDLSRFLDLLFGESLRDRKHLLTRNIA